MNPSPAQAAHNAFLWMCVELLKPGTQARLIRGIQSGGLSLT